MSKRVLVSCLTSLQTVCSSCFLVQVLLARAPLAGLVETVPSLNNNGNAITLIKIPTTVF